MPKKYIVLSPDNIPIHHDTPYFTSIKKAKEYLVQWIQGYQAQGYYSQICYNGYNRQISLEHLPDYCDIININDK